MSDPFKIEGPALISFSGGRTSGYMLWRILQAHGGTLPDDVVPVFANTGKEVEATLQFVRDCQQKWSVHIEWLEYQDADKVDDRWTAVTFDNASRNGEPFAALIERKNYLPNPVARFCTQELKIKPMDRFASNVFGWAGYDVVIGLRADEMSRVARMRSDNRVMPLASAGITKHDVVEFWKNQDFNLMLPSVNGTTPAGNCDLCFLKGAATIQGLVRANPFLATWWIEQENWIGGTFRSDRPSYARMKEMVEEQSEFDFGDADQIIDCFCGDAA